ncbi:peptidase M16 [Pleurocapsa sp. CCALA 161]|uniref:M16 family metallopeptidase n=1 Tax=Pleurocapsa sp. CCALA 161 TaxID=2107688 RepID=UPI000D052D8F|nr:pitrilysin family protein [Pleurocapsa sp. CCALA 161]PSB08026.1 peptidase M16 [Pleurocapsa sp. CCALA 161]
MKSDRANHYGLTKSRWIVVMAIALLWWNCAGLSVLAATQTQTQSSIQPYINRVIKQITEFTLDNGLKFIVLENHEAPVVSFVTYANVGGVDEPDGQTGVAHFLEHLAFKGTQKIGTTNYPAEAKELDKLDTIFAEIQQVQKSGDKTKLAQLTEQFVATQAAANKYVKQNKFGEIVDTAGGVGLNAATSADYTSYFYSFPANKLELWMSLESERFLEPVFREFYQEKQVILEEKRMRTDNSPIGKMIEAFLNTAYDVHPYKRPVIGYDEDLGALSRENVEQFFKTYYSPNNLTVAIAGDVDPDEVRKLAKTYFGRFQPQPQPAGVAKVEPPQTKTKEVTVTFPSQPWYLEGYHIPALSDPDYEVHEVIAELLSSGRTSRLYKSLVEKQQVALSAESFSGFPGNKYPNLMLVYALTAPGTSVDKLATALRAEIERLKTEPVTPKELEQVKTQLKAGLLRTLDSNMGMANLLAEYEAKTGSWRNLFEALTKLEAVTPQDIQRVAQKTFTDSNRTIGKLLPPS